MVYTQCLQHLAGLLSDLLPEHTLHLAVEPDIYSATIGERQAYLAVGSDPIPFISGKCFLFHMFLILA
jgi:hypothetical protein